MGRVRQILGLRESTVVTSAVECARVAEGNLELLTESLAELELTLEDRGWQTMSAQAEQQFSRAGLGNASRVARVMAVANPLIKRGLGVRQAYVWGQGVQVQARATGRDGEEDVNTLVQAFLDAPGNRAAFTGDQAHERHERALGTDGNVFVACFTNPRTGAVQVRTLPFDEIDQVICNPDDRDDPWYYLRVWTSQVMKADGSGFEIRQEKAYYPALSYRPATRPRTIGRVEVRWDAPVYHVKVNALDGWDFGIGDAFAALPFARMYQDFLIDWATLVKSLSQFVWKASAKNGSRAAGLRQALQRRPAGTAPDANPNNAGATALLPEGMNLEAIPKSGATIDSESGRPMAAMVAAALGVPVTMLLADPGQVGSRATAETLDVPTINEMNHRRAVWAEAYRTILAYVIREAVRAPQGPVKGQVTRDPYTGRETVILAGDTDATIEIDWPPLEKTPLDAIVKAIVDADGTAKLPPLVIVKLLLQALGVKDADEILDDVTDDDGNWLDPYREVGDQVGQAAVNAFRRGKDPAAVTRRSEPADDVQDEGPEA
ncbi:hypothetical protein Xcel_0541 [Xylanimonas cellulosilytica DSM 15894]|uniref:Portal protein n=1 Tax=Xylanimonas cellulosilytica (strain DSM 15894 / JCM 12276 / CECT 5975 / KCTC 9989 / LMG 20990 / NBRC 107835 / XIL07) TaxID=446471 RepID=D1BW77_XYLCX|nr:hypothetical protein [Xylanimonas cellulosilytica]ACZ29580.1 hypothetical protein Xcel_0541 [Xylanimonas cellulosilytica DSM 15894]